MKEWFNTINKFLGINEEIIIQWIIILIALVIFLRLGKNLKKLPDKRQSIAEIFVDFVNKFVLNNMGKEFKNFVPYIGTLIIFLSFMNVVGLFGIEPPTKNLSVVFALALITFVIVQVYAIKKQSIKGYFIGYAKPIAPLLPINIMERIMFPISLSLRLFGNITAATVIMELIYDALGKTPFGIAQIGIPVLFHFYFDVFDGLIQMLIFVMLTMINIKVVSKH